MSLLQQIRDEVQRYASGEAVLEAPDLRPLFTELVEYASFNTDPRRLERWIAGLHREWLDSGKLSRLGPELARRIHAHWPRLTQPERTAMVLAGARFVLETDFGVTVPQDPLAIPPGRRAMLRNVSADAKLALWTPTKEAGWKALPFDYIRELGLISPSGITPAGRAFLRLHGLDAVRWLLALELVRSTGPEDEWRCGPDVAAWILAHPRERWHADEDAGAPFAWDTAMRWAALGILDYVHIDEADIYGYHLTAAGKDILTEMTAADPPPLLRLAQGLSADGTAAALRDVGPAGSTATTDIAEQAAGELFRSVVHELRNKLVPLQTAVRILNAALPVEARNEQVTKAWDLATRVIGELFRFAEMTAELPVGQDRAGDWFALEPALRDAIANGRNGRTEAKVSQSGFAGFELRGPQARFVMILANLVRNAVQAVPEGVPVVRIRLDAKAVPPTIDVDDEGPGVAGDLRERIFDAGISMRPGGSGQGLQLVRSAVQREFGGTVTCQEAPGGGARLHLTLAPDRIRRSAGSHSPQGEPQ